MAAADVQLSTRIQQDAQFFDSMLALLPSSYTQQQEPIEQKSKFMHNTSHAALPRQSFKENSKSGQKAKAMFDIKNYTSVLPTNGKGQRNQEDMDDDEDDDDDDEDEDEDDDEEMSDDEDDEPKSKSKSATNAKSSAAAAAPTSSSAAATSVPPTTSMPLPSLSSLSASVGMDQLRQRLHERISGLSQKRKNNDDKKNAKKRKWDEEKKKKREKNKEKPSVHRGKAQQQPQAESEEPATKKSKPNPSSATSATVPSHSSSSSASFTTPSIRASDISENTTDFQFGELKDVRLPSAKSGSYSLAGKQTRKKSTKDSEALKKVEEFESRVERLKEAGEKDQADQLVQQRALQHAMLRAKGIKVKDDKKLLKKSIKKDEKKKEKSRQEWADRLSTQKKQQDAFHAEKIARASKKLKGDRSKYYAPGEEPKEKPAQEGRGRGPAYTASDKGKGSEKKGRAGFEGKAKKKFLN